MSLRSLFIFAAVAMALTFVTPVLAAPLAQASVDEVVVTSMTTFTLTVKIDEVTTLAIPLQVDWRAEGPNASSTDEVAVMISPTVLRTGIFSVTVGSVEPMTGTLAITLTQPTAESAPITSTGAPTDTVVTTATVGTTGTTTVNVPVATSATTNQVSNLRTGPGTDYAIVGSVEAGTTLDVVGQNDDGTWLVLVDGNWIAAFLVDNVPEDLPVVEPTATPIPNPTAVDVLTPTVTPTPSAP